MQKSSAKKKARKAAAQKQQPGMEYLMEPKPEFASLKYKPAGKLSGKTAIITGGDSGIGRAVAVAFAREGCNVAIIYLNETRDAEFTRKAIEEINGKCILLKGDISSEKFCAKAVTACVKKFGSLEVVVNNAAVQYPREDITQITSRQLEKTFRINLFSQFYMVKAALKHLKEGSTIINTTSVTAYRGSGHLIDYSATKGAIVSFTRSLSAGLVKRGIRVNGVAPGPIWTPLIPATFPPKDVATFGTDVPLGRAGQPEETAPCYVFLASDDSSYMTGQILHPNGGEIVNG
ncbi:MAG TPA: SDR family oxidoreductase [Ignavibacteria bacterium]|nr:SDR family oxidoreductase [Ignavibacteria bacterium]